MTICSASPAIMVKGGRPGPLRVFMQATVCVLHRNLRTLVAGCASYVAALCVLFTPPLNKLTKEHKAPTCSPLHV